MSKSVVIIFAKNPVLGKVKTRLASQIGEEKALDVYFKLMEITNSNVKDLNIDKWLFYSDYIDQQDLWHSRSYKKFKQEGDSLGERMLHAFTKAFDAGYKKVVLIGTDIPDLKASIVEEAFNGLAQKEAVIGPARDGGYYLIGLSSLEPDLFLNRTWSHDQVKNQAVSYLKSKGLSYLELKKLKDIDRLQDLSGTGILESTLEGDEWETLFD